MRRRWLAGGLFAAIVSAGSLGRAAGPTLPNLNLVVEARVVEQAALAGGVTLRAGGSVSQGREVQRVRVLNGARAALRLSQLTPLRSVEMVWSGRSPGVSERTQWVDVGRGLTVQPAWPGGSAPVRLELSLESGPPGNAQAERTALQTVVLLPLAEWVTVAELAEAGADARGGFSAATASTAARSLQVRVLAP